MFRRTAKAAIRNPGVAFGQALAPSILIGTIFTGLFRSVERVEGFPSRSYDDWILPGTLFLTAVVGAGFTAAELLRDLDTGFDDRIRLLAGKTGGLVLGRAAVEVPRSLLCASVVLAVSLLRGAHQDGGLLTVPAVLALTAGLAVAWNGIFLLSAAITRNRAAVLGMQPLFFPIMLFSTWFGPRQLMPGWFELIARCNPITWYLDATRSALAGRPDWPLIAAATGFVVALAAVTHLATIRTLSRAVA
jgi:ABC-2 type transport system permease protein